MSKRTQFTPGPWESFNATKGKRAPVGVCDGKRNIRVADVGDRQMSVAVINANARLIAAAPDLYDLCVKLGFAVDDLAMRSSRIPEFLDVLTQAEKTLAAVEGREL